MNLTEALEIKNYENMRVVSLTDKEIVLEMQDGTRVVVFADDDDPVNPKLEYELEESDTEENKCPKTIEDIDRSTSMGKLLFATLVMLSRTCQWKDKTKERLYESVLFNAAHCDCVFMYNDADITNKGD